MLDEKEKQAIKTFESGTPPNSSVAIDEITITYGYGKLDHNGFWEFPIPYSYLKENTDLPLDIEEERKNLEIKLIEKFSVKDIS